jgi:hypothetical protein
VADDFPVLRKNSSGSDIALQSIQDDCSRLQARLRQFDALVNRPSGGKVDLELQRRMAPEVKSSTEQTEALQEKLADTVRQFRELCSWLGEDPQTTQPENLFGWVRRRAGVPPSPPSSLPSYVLAILSPASFLLYRSLASSRALRRRRGLSVSEPRERASSRREGSRRRSRSRALAAAAAAGVVVSGPASQPLRLQAASARLRQRTSSRR